MNLASDNDIVLVMAWLLGALRAGDPYPVLYIPYMRLLLSGGKATLSAGDSSSERKEQR